METKQQPTLQFEQINHHHQLNNIPEKIKKMTVNENENENEKEDEEVVTYTYRSKLPEIYIPNHLPLHDYCFENMGTFGPDRACIIYGPTGRVYSYAEVQQSSRRLALGLHRRLGVGRGDVIMLCLQNCPEFVFAFLAASQLGAMATTANPLCMAAEIGKQAAASQAKVVFVQAAFAEKVSGIAGINVVVVGTTVGGENNNNNNNKVEKDHGVMITFEDLIINSADGDDKFPEVEFQPDDVVALPYSSGTTGLPKGVMLTHKGLVTSVAQQVDGDNPNLYLHSDDVVLCVLPLFHIYSLNSVLLCSLRVGAAILIMPKFDVRTMLELVQRHKVSIAPIVPPICLALAKSPDTSLYDVSSIRTIMSGAAPMGKDLEDVVKSKFPNAALGQGYGMTEAGPVLAMNLAFAKEPMPVKSGACGTVVRNAELKIVDPETGKSQPRNNPGEICIRGDQIMKGYLNDEKATANTIDMDGWLHTGDVGYVDDDDEIFIVDRLKELIKYKGFQVAPAELEGMLINHPQVSDAAVVGMKDEAAGEIPVAFIVKSNGTQITEDDIKQYISNQVVFYKRLGKVFFVDSIPKLPSGKILRKELRARLANIAAASSSVSN